MERRSFLKSMLAMAAAPAICKAENLMKIYIPSQEIYIPAPDILEATDFTFGTGDFTVEAWMNDRNWHHFAKVYNGGKMREYIDGKQVAIGTQEKMMPGVKLVGSEIDRQNNLVVLTPNIHDNNDYKFNGRIDNIRATKGVCRDPMKEFEQYRGDYESQQKKFPNVGYAINKQEPQRSKLLDWMMSKNTPILSIDGKALT